MAKYKLSKTSNKRIEGIDQRLQDLVGRVIKISPHDFGIPKDGGIREAKRQYELFIIRPSVTNCDGYKRLSYHQSGKAFDIFLYDEHKACWAKGCYHKYDAIAEVFKSEFKLMKEEGIFEENEIFRWGGDWGRPDRPHFELKTIE